MARAENVPTLAEFVGGGKVAEEFQGMWMQAVIVELVKRLGGSVVFPENFLLERLFDNQERIEIRRGDDGSEELTLGETPPEHRYPPEMRKTGREVAAKYGRNQPCPCGSGKKFKRCCGA